MPPKRNEHKLPDSGDTTFDAGTGTLYIREKDIDYDDAKAAIGYFENKSVTEKNKQETHFCELAIFCIKKCFGI